MITIQQIEFAMRDLGLYLNTHPSDSAAIVEWKRLEKMRDEMLRSMGNMKVAHDRWVWVNNPWPWEYGASENYQKKENIAGQNAYIMPEAYPKVKPNARAESEKYPVAKPNPNAAPEKHHAVKPNAYPKAKEQSAMPGANGVNMKPQQWNVQPNGGAK